MTSYEELMMNALDDTITPSDRALLNTYLAQRPDERAAFEHMLAVDLELKAVEPVAPPTHFAQNVMAQARVTPIFRPLPRKQLAAVVAGNSLIALYVWLMCIGLFIGAGILIAQLPEAQLLIGFLRAIFINITDAARALGSVTRAVIEQPIAWVVLFVAAATVAAWVTLVARVYLPQRRLAMAQP